MPSFLLLTPSHAFTLVVFHMGFLSHLIFHTHSFSPSFFSTFSHALFLDLSSLFLFRYFLLYLTLAFSCVLTLSLSPPLSFCLFPSCSHYFLIHIHADFFLHTCSFWILVYSCPLLFSCPHSLSHAWSLCCTFTFFFTTLHPS